MESVRLRPGRGILTAVEGPDGKPALRLDYDFHGGGGFVVARKEVPVRTARRLSISGSPCVARGCRTISSSKSPIRAVSNAWRFLKEDAALPADWTEVRIRERDLPFAWGPAGGGAPKSVGAVELVIAAGPGGKGSVCFSDLMLEDQTLYHAAGGQRFEPSTEQSAGVGFRGGLAKWLAGGRD